MACVHLTQLYQLCRDSQLQLSSADLIHIVCKQCNQEEVCPAMLYEEYDATVAERQALAEAARKPADDKSAHAKPADSRPS